MRSEVVSMYLRMDAPPEGLERAGDTASVLYEALDVLIDLANSATGVLRRQLSILIIHRYAGSLTTNPLFLS